MGWWRRAVAGDRAGFAALVSRHYDMVFRVAWKWCGNREDAEDIAQDVCVRLGQTIRSYSGQAKFTTWLYRVVLNAARDHYRKRASHAKKLDAWAKEPTRPDIQEAVPKTRAMKRRKSFGLRCANCLPNNGTQCAAGLRGGAFTPGSRDCHGVRGRHGVLKYFRRKKTTKGAFK